LDAFGDRTQENIFNSLGVPLLLHNDAYDSLGRLTSDAGSAGQTSSYTYDFNYNLLTTTDPSSHLSQQSVDALNRVFKATDTNKGVTSWTYDAHDRITKVTDPAGAVTSSIYDGFGDLIQQISPVTGTTVYRYDAAGNLTQKIDSRGVTTNFTFDALNRKTASSYPNSSAENVTLTYDQSGHGFGIGRLTSVIDGAGTLSRSFDERGNIVSESRVHSGVTLGTAYTYDGGSRISSITYPSGALVNYARDSIGRISGITEKSPGGSTATVLSNIGYQPFGRISAQAFGNSVLETRSFDSDYEMTNVTGGAGSPLQNLTYTFDADGNVTSVTDAVGLNTQTLNYDNLDHLAGATGTYGTLSYIYDANGNRLSDGPNSSALDGLGTVTGFAYNQSGRLASTTSGAQQLTQYSYDAFGRRIVKTGTVTTTTLYQYDPAGLLLEETDGHGTPIADFIYEDGRPIAEIANGGTLYFMHDDPLGTPSAVTNGKQGVVWSATYQPFGTVIGAASQLSFLSMDLRLPGQEIDLETGLYHNGFRDYASNLGRYMQSDPAGLVSGLNLYAYADSNPFTNFDRYGLDLNQDLAAAGGQISNLAVQTAARAPGIFLRYPLEQTAAKELIHGIRPSASAPPSELLGQFYPGARFRTPAEITSVSGKPCF
jgi:RHS repeat-associated protein